MVDHSVLINIKKVVMFCVNLDYKSDLDIIKKVNYKINLPDKFRFTNKP